jgi:hypothetical protein
MQRLSECSKKGEPEDHRLAVNFTRDFLEYSKVDKDYRIEPDYPVVYDAKFCKQLPNNREYEGHLFDLAILDVNNHPICFIEINGNIGFYYHVSNNSNFRVKRAKPTKHSHELQMRNDRINRNYVETHYPKATYKVLFKEEVLGNCGKNGKDKDYLINRLEYLRNELKDWIT